MSDYISREAAVTIADYAADEHPYDKNPKQLETYSEYNQGWNDACDYIRGKLDDEKPPGENPGVAAFNQALAKSRGVRADAIRPCRGEGVKNPRRIPGVGKWVRAAGAGHLAAPWSS